MNQSELLKKFRDELSTYSDFSEIKYETKYVALFERIFGKENQLTQQASDIAQGWGAKGAVDAMYGQISAEQFNRNKHDAFTSLLNEAIDFIEMENMLTGNGSNLNAEKNVDNRVFIVHGHDEALKYQLAEWLRKIGVDPIILHEQANKGITSILEKLEKYSCVGCAIILFTSDDVGSEKENAENMKPRARQNVVFEAGLFIGLLGKDRVIMLCEKGVELPGDLSGCVYIEADEYGGWKEQLRTEFNAIGMKYSH